MTAKELLTAFASGETDFMDEEFAGEDFSGAQLSGICLAASNFKGCKFKGANLSSAELEDCDFTNADLSNANLSSANLQNAILTNTNLTGANISGTILEVKITPATRTYRRNITETDFDEMTTRDIETSHTASFGQLKRQYAEIKLKVTPASVAFTGKIFATHVIDKAKNLVLNICVDDSVIKVEYQAGIVAAVKKAKGILIGGKLTSMTINVVGGRMHPDDSTPLAFEEATALALKEALNKGRSKILEPIYTITVFYEEDHHSDIMTLINHHRGAVDNMANPHGCYEIIFTMPYSELKAFETAYKQFGSANGQYDAAFSHYEPLDVGHEKALIAAYQQK